MGCTFCTAQMSQTDTSFLLPKPKPNINQKKKPNWTKKTSTSQEILVEQDWVQAEQKEKEGLWKGTEGICKWKELVLHLRCSKTKEKLKKKKKKGVLGNCEKGKKIMKGSFHRL